MKKLIGLLKEGAEVWNQWRQSHPEMEIDLSNVNLKGATLNQVNFREAKLSGANLIGALLRNADLGGASFYMTKLNRANLDEANLTEANIQKADLTGASLRGAKLNRANLVYTKLIKANCRESNITGASLIAANLMNADFSKTVLSKSNLSRIQALSTNFNKANLTGACIEDWHINSNTNFEGVNCEYVYLKAIQHERRPSSGIFLPGQFTKLFQEVLNTVDLIFQDEIDWKAFFTAFKKVQVENKDVPLDIQSIENKRDGSVVIKVNVPIDTNKEKIHSNLIQEYNSTLKSLEAQYKAQLSAKDIEIAIYRQTKADMQETIKLLANKPINVEAKAMAQGNIHQQGNFGVGVNPGEISGDAQIVGVYNEAQQQNLAEAAKEIQALLDQLSQAYPTETKKEKRIFAAEAMDLIEQNPSLIQKLLSAAKAGSLSAIESMLNHPAASFVIAALGDLQES